MFCFDQLVRSVARYNYKIQKRQAIVGLFNFQVRFLRSSMMTTLYEVLGVREDASQSEIEEAYLNIIKFYQYKDSMVGKSKKQPVNF